MTPRIITTMLDKKNIIEYFNAHASAWDEEMIKNEKAVARILDNAGVSAGKDILDVATGTGVLIPDYKERNVASVTAIDISPEMAAICAHKFPDVNVICGDVETASFERLFDCIVVYNAFPHFPDPEKLIERLSSQLKPGGSLTVAHGMSREKIDRHHEGSASKVSNGLMHEDELAEIFSKFLTVTHKISDSEMYQVVGEKADR